MLRRTVAIPSDLIEHRQAPETRAWIMLKQTLLSLVAMSVLACSGSPSGAGAGSVLSPSATPWERKLDAHYTHYGVATIEQIGGRYLLRIECAGVHDVYALGAAEVQLGAYLGAPLRVHYVYETRVNANIRCIQPPCVPVQEQVAMISQVERLTEAETSKARAARECDRH